MKDIKSLYLAAKTSGNPKDISAYTEAVHDLFDNNPDRYIPNLEYIISSDIGLQTLKEFVEKYGLPICCYDDVVTCLEKCIHKCELTKKDDSDYKEALNYMESFRQKYIGCFMMESYFSEKSLPSYTSTYYRCNDKGVQNRRLMTGMIDKYGETAIPDIIITADKIGGNALDSAINYIENHDSFGTPVVCEWLLEATKNVVDGESLILDRVKTKAVSSVVNKAKDKADKAFKEGVLLADDSIMIEYSEAEVSAMEELLSITEYKLTWSDEITESVKDIQDTIYSLYEQLDGLDGTKDISEAEADSIIPMLPGSKPGTIKPIKEGQWLVNTRNKKTGEIPGYIKHNHNLGYGEDDSTSSDTHQGSLTDGGDSEASLDDFKRPSATDVSTPYSNLDDEDDDNKGSDNKLTDAEKKAINNYYYYTYNNSLNKNTDSFNRNRNNNSTNNDHSTHSSVKRTNDDYSTGKRINSDNIGSASKDDEEFKPVGESVGESVIKQPWELDIFGENTTLYDEGVKDIFRKIGNKVKGLFTLKKTLNNIQSLDTPAAVKAPVPLLIPGTNIPIMQDKAKLESSDLEDLLDKGFVITEDGFGSFGMSKYDMANVVKRLRKKFNAEILFISNNNLSIAQQIGIASVVETDRASIEKLMRGKNVDRLPGRLIGDEGQFEKVIFVNPSMVRDFMISTPDELELIISHEYGHVLTFDKITSDDWVEYQTKRSMISGLAQILYPEDIQAMAECNMTYYKLKPEALANNVMNIDPAKLTYAVMKRRATGKLDKLNMEGVVNWKIPESIMKLNRDALAGKNTLNIQELTETVRLSAALYKNIVRDKNTLDSILKSMENTVKFYESQMSSKTESTYLEDVGDADDDRPESDHPIKDILTDVDRSLIKKQQDVKRVAQNVQNAGRAFIKPAVRTSQWVNNMVTNWKDADENNIKEKMADPHARSNLFSAIRKAVEVGSLYKAGLLLNPIILFLTVTRGIGRNKKHMRLRNEMIGELKTEIEIIEEKIKDADRVGDNSAKYKLMRFKNELNKKLLRIGGSKGWNKIL